MVLEAWPAEKRTVPEGSTPRAKSAASAVLAPMPLTAQLAELAAVVSPVRVTVKVKGVLPEKPSGLLASVAAIASSGSGGASSLRMVPVAEENSGLMDAPAGSERETVKVSSASKVVSPATRTVMLRAL